MDPDNIDIEAVGSQVTTFMGQAQVWLAAFLERALSIAMLWQVGIIIAAAAIGWLASRVPRRMLLHVAEKYAAAVMYSRFCRSFAKVSWPLISVILIWCAAFGFSLAGLPYEGLRIVGSLMNAWIVVRLMTLNMRETIWSTLFAVIAWTVAALFILHLLQPTLDLLRSTHVAGTKINALTLLANILIAIAALWLGRVAGDAAQIKLRSTRQLNPSTAGLLGQVTKIVVIGFAVVVALQSIGVPLGALAVFSGALGVGIGFGLQSIFSNFISGVIILFEKSVKVGDFIELPSGVTGLVNEINIRSTLVTTNDNVDILVPNEEFIKAQVINWTLREARRRIRVPFGVAYGTDKDLVRQAGLEAAAEVNWTLENMGPRAPQVWLVGFGDSSLDFELVVWLNEEAVKKPSKVKADYNWALHTALERHNIEIPFPQRDLNLKPPGPIRVRIEPQDAPAQADPETEKAPEE
ncbi:mechanosensitive ion channel family protein [Hyphomonas johnsonii]|uniref:Small conductance mechanosensitive ion channel (MscS) family protein n=1 Tax=Hyphomonas johnsonii MHS-2 TaxID=1280950 RepID=A0A059FPW3_9PROT|nr:mechanosensitive ion channel domain-containing protein [Hyphomonas johnsonii]KCZ92725.1 small conductance mechanosensitive ion channel (MscS) family protein [Hyphomonas johnsonii MHS-2]